MHKDSPDGFVNFDVVPTVYTGGSHSGGMCTERNELNYFLVTRKPFSPNRDSGPNRHSRLTSPDSISP